MTVMCGGKGTRLGQPIKCLTEVHGAPFMDWKLRQLRRQGFTQITLAVGPFFLPFWERYGDTVAYICDRQEGTLAVAESLPQPSWWCNGDTLLDLRVDHFPLFKNAVEGFGPIPSIGVCTNYLVEPANVPGGWLDAGYYYGLPPYEWRIVEVRPYHINTPEDLAVTERYLRRSSAWWVDTPKKIMDMPSFARSKARSRREIVG